MKPITPQVWGKTGSEGGMGLNIYKHAYKKTFGNVFWVTVRQSNQKIDNIQAACVIMLVDKGGKMTLALAYD